jgi:hypothetical protein
MSELINKIRFSQLNAGEETVIKHLREKGLLKDQKSVPIHNDKLTEALNLLRQYEVFEAMLLEDNQMWWPSVPKDKISGKTYDMMLELQAKRNELLKTTPCQTATPNQ